MQKKTLFFTFFLNSLHISEKSCTFAPTKCKNVKMRKCENVKM